MISRSVGIGGQRTPYHPAAGGQAVCQSGAAVHEQQENPWREQACRLCGCKFNYLQPKAPHGLELSGSAYNLFDTKYSDPGGDEHKQDSIEQDGRTFRVKLTYRF